MVYAQLYLPAFLLLAATSSEPQCAGVAGEKHLENKVATAPYECDIVYEGVQMPPAICRNYLSPDGQKYVAAFEISSGGLAFVGRFNPDGSVLDIWVPLDRASGCR